MKRVKAIVFSNSEEGGQKCFVATLLKKEKVISLEKDCKSPFIGPWPNLSATTSNFEMQERLKHLSA